MHTMQYVKPFFIQIALFSKTLANMLQVAALLKLPTDRLCMIAAGSGHTMLRIACQPHDGPTIGVVLAPLLEHSEQMVDS